MHVLDTTVRDGSYAVDFKLSTRDIQNIVSKSVNLGIDYIEIGHGLGLNASSPMHGVALHSDEEYIEAAAKVAKDKKLGAFCIPGIAGIEDIEKAKETGLSFVRIGVNPDEYNNAFPYIEEACRVGLEVFINIMKTYTESPDNIAYKASDSYNRGVRCIYIVDSAGCMDSDDIDYYIDAIRKKSNINIGFHGHNNLGLAVANTIHCVEQGVEFIDCTYQGLGRSAGNASIEQVVMLLKKKGYDIDYDIAKVLEYGYSCLRNIVKEGLINPLDYMCGYAGFHSGYIKDIYRCCNEKEVDPLRLILAYSKTSRTRMDYKKLCYVADSLPKDYDENPYGFGEYFSEKFN